MPCKHGLEGIVSKLKDSPHRPGRSRNWVKKKNPACAIGARNAGDDHTHHAHVKGDFVVTGPQVEPKFKSRHELRDWCVQHHPGLPIEQLGPGGKRAAKQRPRNGAKRTVTRGSVHVIAFPFGSTPEIQNPLQAERMRDLALNGFFLPSAAARV